MLGARQNTLRHFAFRAYVQQQQITAGFEPLLKIRRIDFVDHGNSRLNTIAN
jgi:hypothetical protein